jgi:hypothetical protein
LEQVADKRGDISGHEVNTAPAGQIRVGPEGCAPCHKPRFFGKALPDPAKIVFRIDLKHRHTQQGRSTLPAFGHNPLPGNG